MTLLLIIISSYLLGSIPTAYLLGKALKGIDIRKLGSGNTGATNAFRVLGKPIGISVLFFDILKGFIAVTVLASTLTQPLIISKEATVIILGLIAISGHIWPIFLRFKGGKGVATSLGVLLGLVLSIGDLRLVLLISLSSWIVLFLTTGFVSLASISSAIVFFLATFYLVDSIEIIIFSFVVAFFAIIRHKSNIYRLLGKKESRVKLPWLGH